MGLNDSIDHLFRHHYSRIVALLAGKYSTAHIDLIEDAVQEALLKAMQVWSYQQMPGNPTGWLYRVANNKLIDQLRKLQRRRPLAGIEFQLSDFPDAHEPSEDARLKMIFACCHPELKSSQQIMLCLKLLCGFSIREIAHALMVNEETVKKTITRAKKKFKNNVGSLALPESKLLPGRLDVVCKVLYLMFNEGYKASAGNQLIKNSIYQDAIWLAELLPRQPFCNTPEVNALLAMMYFKASRFKARSGPNGELITLARQNRKLWDAFYIEKGVDYLSKSAHGVKLSQYHLEAGIASYYSLAADFGSTDWVNILQLYNKLFQMTRSPVVALNRVVVLEKVHGSEAAFAELETLEQHAQLRKNHLLYAIKADLEVARGNPAVGAMLLRQAADLATNAVEKNFLLNKMQQVLSGSHAADPADSHS